MNLLKRASLSIARTPRKSFLLFALVFVLGAFLSSAISIRNAIHQTEENLRTQLPAVASLGWEFSEGQLVNGMIHLEFPTYEMIIDVGQLSYVQAYDFSGSSHLFSHELRMVRPLFEEYSSFEEIFSNNVELQNGLTSLSLGLRSHGGLVEIFNAKGVSVSKPADFQLELVSLVSGRLMVEEELEQGLPVIVISQQLAIENDLQIGSVITLEYNVFDDVAMMEADIMTPFLYWHLEEFIFVQETFEFEVIGLFEVNSDILHIDDETAEYAAFILNDLYNQIYLPYQLLAGTIQTLAPYITENFVAREYWNYGGVSVEFPSLEETPLILDSIFILDDPRHLHAFSEAAAVILPEYWNIYDFSNAFAPMTSSMDTMLEISNLIFIGAIVATIICLGLLIMLFLKDRKFELGIYQALGESKHRIASQILIEIVVISTFAMSFAFFAGSVVANTISRQMLEQNLNNQFEENPNSFFDVVSSVPMAMVNFTPAPLTLEEMMEAYDTSLDKNSIIIFFSVGIGAVLVSTIIPVAHVLQQEPKDNLLKRNFG